MAISDSREGASSRQDRTIQPPAVQPTGVYTRQQLQNNLKASKETIAKWMKMGLDPIPNTGTGTALFFAEDVYQFLRNLKSEGD